MSTVQEIERVIKTLPPKDFNRLADWIEKRRAEQWDREIERDARDGGPLDRLAREAIAEYKAGRAKKLPR